MSKTLDKVTTGQLCSEIVNRLSEKDYQQIETNERAIELESCVALLLKKRTPTEETYKFVEQALRPLQPNLRNPALYRLACKRANVAGSIFVK